MSREASGLRLSADSPAGYQAPTNGMRLEQCWLRYSLLLLVVMAGICSATAMRMVPAHHASSLAAKPADIRSGTGVLPVCAIALLFLGSLRLLLAGVSRERQVETKRQVWSLARESSPRFWRAPEDERKHLSRELHDSVGQILTAVGLQLRALRSTPLSPEERRTLFDETCRLNAEALRQVRDLAMGLRPALLDDVSLVTALEWQTRQFSRQSGISASLEAKGEIAELPETHRLCIYRCVQEALTNCAKHSHAKNIRIVVLGSVDGVSVTIVDDGIGFDRSKGVRGIGLLGMRERVADVNGSLSIASQDHRGTALTLEIPVPQSVLV